MANRVPNALIRRLCTPTSYRLEKMTYLVYPPPPPVRLSPTQAYRANYPYHERGAYTVQQQRLNLTGNLKNEEYRFFVGASYESSNTCRCRWCDEYLPSQKLRDDHKRKGCKPKLIELYKGWLKAEKCIMCGKDKRLEYWGLPFCTMMCRSNWRFEDMPGAAKMEIARRKVLDKEPLT